MTRRQNKTLDLLQEACPSDGWHAGWSSSQSLSGAAEMKVEAEIERGLVIRAREHKGRRLGRVDPVLWRVTLSRVDADGEYQNVLWSMKATAPDILDALRVVLADVLGTGLTLLKHMPNLADEIMRRDNT